MVTILHWLILLRCFYLKKANMCDHVDVTECLREFHIVHAHKRTYVCVPNPYQEIYLKI